MNMQDNAADVIADLVQGIENSQNNNNFDLEQQSRYKSLQQEEHTFVDNVEKEVKEKKYPGFFSKFKIIIIGVIVTFIIGLVVYLVYRRHQTKKQKELQELKQSLISNKQTFTPDNKNINIPSEQTVQTILKAEQVKQENKQKLTEKANELIDQLDDEDNSVDLEKSNIKEYQSSESLNKNDQQKMLEPIVEIQNDSDTESEKSIKDNINTSEQQKIDDSVLKDEEENTFEYTI